MSRLGLRLLGGEALLGLEVRRRGNRSAFSHTRQPGTRCCRFAAPAQQMRGQEAACDHGLQGQRRRQGLQRMQAVLHTCAQAAEGLGHQQRGYAKLGQQGPGLRTETRASRKRAALFEAVVALHEALQGVSQLALLFRCVPLHGAPPHRPSARARMPF